MQFVCVIDLRDQFVRSKVHISWLTYRSYLLHGRWYAQGTDNNYLSVIGINFLLLLLQPSGKLRKPLISIWRIRILGFHHYSNTSLQPYWAMALLVTLALPLGNGYTSKVYTTSWTYSVGTKKNSKLFLPNRYTPLMTMVRVYTLGPTKLNKYVCS